jgi:excinuclease ABC subunit A
VVDRLVLRPGIEARLSDSLQLAFRCSGGFAWVERLGTEGEVAATVRFAERPCCPDCERVIPEPTPALFSFNSPLGACPRCKGLGVTQHVEPARLVENPSAPLDGGAMRAWKFVGSPHYRTALLEGLAKQFRFSPQTAWEALPKEARQAVLFGSEKPIRVAVKRGGTTRRFEVRFPGLVALLERKLNDRADPEIQEILAPYLATRTCAECQGARLRPEALAVTVGGHSIAEITRQSVAEARAFFHQLELAPRERLVAERILEELDERLRCLAELGLDYLTLDRRADSLSGGEAQRLRLASQIGSHLSGVLYVLDEPSVGLHPRDQDRLLSALFQLRERGNTVVVVEHDRHTILAADYVIDLGPGAGARGGEVVAAGSPQEILEHPTSLTAHYLSGRKRLPIPEQRRPGNGWCLRLSGVRTHNLKDIEVEIPLGTFTCVSGVSGAGKSSLVIETLYKALAERLHGSTEPAGSFRELSGWQLLDKVVIVDQHPFSRSPRSNPATYTGLFTPLRDWFASLPDARARGYSAGRFSFNVKGGRCEACKGEGQLRIAMHFLPDVYVTCEVCKGSRYDPATLEVRYKGYSIADVLNLSVSEAYELFTAIPAIQQKLRVLQEIGLGYLPLGQPATTLSGGEIQRLKLAKELSRRASGRTMYILDEPTTGLHFEDIRLLLEVLQRLVDAGNTVIVVEHNPEVIAAADYVIDLGPEGGAAGGRVVAAGPPEAIAAAADSYTGRYLRPILSGSSTASPYRAAQTGHRHASVGPSDPG